MKISNGVDVIELNIQGFTLNPTLIWDEGSAVLIDTGMPGQLEAIKSAMSNVGVPFERLKAIILTHQDLDHIGSLPEILLTSDQQIEVYAHLFDKPYIEGHLHLIKTDPSKLKKEEWDSIPDPLKGMYTNPPKAKVDKILEDGQELPFFGGIQVIFTPGHTPGHISLFLQKSKTLVAGDALVCVEGSLRGPVQRTTLDMEKAIASIEKLFHFDIETVICYHGGVCQGNIRAQLQRIVDKVDGRIV